MMVEPDDYSGSSDGGRIPRLTDANWCIHDREPARADPWTVGCLGAGRQVYRRQSPRRPDAQVQIRAGRARAEGHGEAPRTPLFSPSRSMDRRTSAQLRHPTDGTFLVLDGSNPATTRCRSTSSAGHARAGGGGGGHLLPATASSRISRPRTDGGSARSWMQRETVAGVPIAVIPQTIDGKRPSSFPGHRRTSAEDGTFRVEA